MTARAATTPQSSRARASAVSAIWTGFAIVTSALAIVSMADAIVTYQEWFQKLYIEPARALKELVRSAFAWVPFTLPDIWVEYFVISGIFVRSFFATSNMKNEYGRDYVEATFGIWLLLFFMWPVAIFVFLFIAALHILFEIFSMLLWRFLRVKLPSLKWGAFGSFLAITLLSLGLAFAIILLTAEKIVG